MCARSTKIRLRVQLCDRVPPGCGEALVPPRGTERARRCAVDGVRQVHQGRAHDAVIRQRQDALGRSLDRVQALDREQARVRAARPRRAIAGDRPDLLETPRGPRDQRAQRREVVQEHAPARRGAAKRIRRDRPHRAVETAVEQAWQVEMSEEKPSQRAAAVADERVVAPQARGDERVDVQVDELGFVRQLQRVERTAKRSRHAASVGRRRSSRAPVPRPLRPSPDCHRRPLRVIPPELETDDRDVARRAPARRATSRRRGGRHRDGNTPRVDLHRRAGDRCMPPGGGGGLRDRNVPGPGPGSRRSGPLDAVAGLARPGLLRIRARGDQVLRRPARRGRGEHWRRRVEELDPHRVVADGDLLRRSVGVHQRTGSRARCRTSWRSDRRTCASKMPARRPRSAPCGRCRTGRRARRPAPTRAAPRVLAASAPVLPPAS